MAVKKDSKGRAKRKCRKRVDPLKVYRKREFVSRYRLSKKLVEMLTKRFQPHNSTKGMKNGGGISHSQKFNLALRYFSTGGIYTLVGDTQHVSKALVSRSVKDVSNYFYAHRDEYIQWPGTFEEKLTKAKDFFSHKGQKTPKVIGMVDGTHVAIKTPLQNESCYVNRNNYHSINTTIIADFNKRIMYVDPRWAGSVNDAYSFNCSPVGDLCNSGKMGDFIILGDSGYGLKKNVFIPYRNPATRQQKGFNTWHKRNRARVEHTIGLLKQRFRCLDSASGYLYHSPAQCAKIITTCCCLHNVAMDYGIKITTHRNDPWVQKRRRLRQPAQRRNRTEIKNDIKKVRDKYADTFF